MSTKQRKEYSTFFCLHIRSQRTLFVSFSSRKSTQTLLQSKTHLYFCLLWTLPQLKVHHDTYSIILLIKYKHFIDLIFLGQCRCTGSYSLLFYSCLSIDSNKVGLSDNVKRGHHAFFLSIPIEFLPYKYISN